MTTPITITIAREALDDGTPGFVVKLGSLELLARSEADAAEFAADLATSIAARTVEEVRIHSTAHRRH